MQKPSICRDVVIKGKTLSMNGTDEHPAKITRAWTDHCVNVTVFQDAVQGLRVCTSVPFFQTRDQALIYLATGPDTAIACFWPERVS